MVALLMWLYFVERRDEWFFYGKKKVREEEAAVGEGRRAAMSGIVLHAQSNAQQNRLCTCEEKR